jgi:hypothetical protein
MSEAHKDELPRTVDPSDPAKTFQELVFGRLDDYDRRNPTPQEDQEEHGPGNDNI